MYADIEGRLRRGLGPGVQVGAGPVDPGALAALHPAERAAVEGSVPKRQDEFATGRVLARGVLARLGCADTALLPHADRSPCWPAGVTGSISHTDGLAIVVAAGLSTTPGLGVDAEEDTPLERELWPLILRDRERTLVERTGTSELERRRLAKLIFCIKEAVYKCQYPLTRVMFDFPEVELERWEGAHAGDGTFAARILHPSRTGDPRLSRALEGLFFRADRWIVSALALAPCVSEPVATRGPTGG